jgi:hypothetical protein
MRRASSLAILFSAFTVLSLACSSTGTSQSSPGGGSAGASASEQGGSGDAGDGGAAGEGGQGAGGGLALGGGGSTTSSAAHLKGKVVAPEGSIPISGALVYFSPTPPPAIPDGVHCDRCVKLDDSIPYTQTNPDGTFDLGTGTGDGYFVVQKGSFRRVRKVTVPQGDTAVPIEFSTMPSRMDKANGDDIPRIAVVLGAWDPIELVLARMGLEAKVTKDFLGRARVLSKDATSFAIYGLHDLGEVSPYPPANTLITTPGEIEKYDIVFFPCSGGTDGDPSGGGLACSGVFLSNPSVLSTLDGFVRKGGRVYASDWSYEYVRQVFKGFVTWKGENQQIGSACESGGGEESASAPDEGLAAWLKAQGQDLVSVKDAWTHVDGVHPTMDVDADGKPTTETPKVWVSAGSKPAATSFRHGCGRVLYSTYHTQPTSETNGPLEPQALSLLYLILEVGVCIDPSEIK